MKHGMHTQYGDYLNWLIANGRIDVVLELESVFGKDSTGGHNNLWSDFETALGQYVLEKAAEWDMDSLYITESQVGNMNFPLHNMKFREQTYSNFESMDCVTQAMKESVGYQGKMKFGSGNVNCSQIRVIPVPKTWNLV